MDIFEDISGDSVGIGVSEIEKGWSRDKKFYIRNKYGKEFPLGVSDVQAFLITMTNQNFRWCYYGNVESVAWLS